MSIEARRSKSGAMRYTARIKHAGQTVASRTFARKADAETWEREQYRALQLGEFTPPSRSSKPLAQVAAEFLESRRGQVGDHSWRTDRDHLKSIPTWFAARPISSISESDILKYLTEQLTLRARSTVQRAKTTLGTVFAYAVRERMISRNPMRDVRMPPGKGQASQGIETFTAAELTHTLELQYSINPRLAEVTEFLSLTGLRWSELRALRVRDLQELPFRAIRVSRAHSDGYAEKGTKTGKTRAVPLTNRAWHLASARTEGRKRTDYLFTSETGLQLRGNLFRRFVHWSDTVPDGRTIHDLRHYAASIWLRAGIPVHQVSQWLGHANPNTTLKVYAHVLGEAQDLAAIARLNRIEQQQPRANITTEWDRIASVEGAGDQPGMSLD
jgi:integrase